LPQFSLFDILSAADDDFAVSGVAEHLKKTTDAAFFRNRSMTTPFTLYNSETQFMEAQNCDGSWAGEDAGWTEGDKCAGSGLCCARS